MVRLSLEDLTYRLSFKTLIDPQSWSLAAGETLVLTGPTGGGKSLLLRLLNGLVAPSGGRVYLDGTDCAILPTHQLRQRVMLVPERPQLLGMTVQDALLYPLRLQGLSLAAAEARITALLLQWPIEQSWLHQTAAQLPASACQRVAIGRGLIAAPQVLMVDAPQTLMAEESIEKLRAIARHQDMALIFTGQNLAADRYAYLEAGALRWETTCIDWPEVTARIDRWEQAQNAYWD